MSRETPASTAISAPCQVRLVRFSRYSHLRAMRAPIVVLISLGALLATLALASSAQALSPWWHLTSGPRPAYLHAGASKPAIPGEDEVQQITVPLVGGEGGFVLKFGGVGIEELATEPLASELGITAMSAPNIQKLLEGPYGPSVKVSEEVLGEEIIFRIETDPGVAPVETGNLGFGKPDVKVTNPGKPEVAAVPDGQIYLTAENLGDANTAGKVTLKDVLPKGLKATDIVASKPFVEADFHQRSPISCTLATLTCTMNEPLAPYDQLEMRISVEVQPGAEAEEQINEAIVQGGGASESSIRRKVTISSAPVPYAIERNELALEEEGGAPTTQAGAHPFQLTSTIQLNQGRDIEPLHAKSAKPEVAPPELAKDVNVKLPPGLIGNATVMPQCTTAQFFETVESKANRCPPDTAVGVATVTVHEPTTVGTAILTEPIFNLEPRVGEPARFGFYVVIANSPVFIDTSVRTGSDYGVTVDVSNITQTAAFLSSETTFWGVPGDPRHDSQRGWGCLYRERESPIPTQPCIPAEEAHPRPFLSMPTNCTAPMATSIDTDSWAAAGAFQSFTGVFEPATALENCNRLQFAPEIRVSPDGQEAAKPTGLTVDVHVPQEVNENAKGFASANVKTITVTLPPGLTLNPSAADGLLACSEDQVGLLPGIGEQGEFLFTPTLSQAFCPDASKIGTVKIKSPLLPADQPIEGALYLATPAPNGEAAHNPFNSLLAMYIIARDPISGVLVKLPGKATLDPDSGQITTTFENSPQVAFEDAEIHLFGGERAPLATPPTCGPKETKASFVPWSGAPPVSSSSTFEVTSGPNGAPCPQGALPFTPSLTAGATNINAGSFSPLSTTINREDGNQQIKAVSLHMPEGLSGILKGVELCPEAQANAGTCSQGSLIGHTIVSVGIGADPFSVTGGQVFLTETYKGAPFGLSIVNPAVAGPFDLGKVIVRAKIEVDPHTAALTVSTDQTGPFAIPHILDGIPLQIKHVNVLIDRPGFIFNPTSCDPKSITGTIESSEGANSPVSTPFQATNCATLKFAPKFQVSTSGQTSKAAGASLKVKLTYPNAPAGTYANLAKAKVSLPKQLPSRLTTLQKACTAAAFEKNPESCPKESIVGQAKVITPLLPVPLQGPAYFVSHGGEAFPDLTIVLKGYGLTIDLVGSTQIKNGITTTTFKATPDAPFNSFELNLPQGKYSALAANANLCAAKNLTMPTEFTAQNGAPFNQKTKIAVTGCKPHRRLSALQRALKACRAKHSKAKRKACEVRARKRFSKKKGKGKRK